MGCGLELEIRHNVPQDVADRRGEDALGLADVALEEPLNDGVSIDRQTNGSPELRIVSRLQRLIELNDHHVSPAGAVHLEERWIRSDPACGD